MAMIPLPPTPRSLSSRLVRGAILVVSVFLLASLLLAWITIRGPRPVAPRSHAIPVSVQAGGEPLFTLPKDQ